MANLKQSKVVPFVLQFDLCCLDDSLFSPGFSGEFCPHNSLLCAYSNQFTGLGVPLLYVGQ